MHMSTVIENGTYGFYIFIYLDTAPAMVVLILTNVVSPAWDYGYYIVTVTNPAGSDSSVFHVTVTGEDKIHVHVEVSMSPFLICSSTQYN